MGLMINILLSSDQLMKVYPSLTEAQAQTFRMLVFGRIQFLRSLRSNNERYVTQEISKILSLLISFGCNEKQIADMCE